MELGAKKGGKLGGLPGKFCICEPTVHEGALSLLALAELFIAGSLAPECCLHVEKPAFFGTCWESSYACGKQEVASVPTRQLARSRCERVFHSKIDAKLMGSGLLVV